MFWDGFFSWVRPFLDIDARDIGQIVGLLFWFLVLAVVAAAVSKVFSRASGPGR